MSDVLELLNRFEDTRDAKKVKHPLPTILFISICAIFCGAEGWEDIVMWAQTHKRWLSKYVDVSEDIPSYSTIRRVFMMFSPHAWGKMIRQSVVDACSDSLEEDHVAIDGKTLRGSKCNAKEVRAMQMVSAWSVENNIILGEVKTDIKSNEVTAIPLLLDLLDLDGATVSIDAIGCNEKIISTTLGQGAHYVIGLKKNQPKLYEAVEKHIQSEVKANLDHLTKAYFDASHGRLVQRRYFVFDVPQAIASLGFTDMNTIIATETISSSNHQNKLTSEWRYYFSDHDKTNNKLPDYIRGHWQVESMHWCLDVHLNDDKDKKYTKNAAENFAKTKRFLLNLVNTKPPTGKKRSLRSNLKLVGWNLDYLVRLLFA